MARGQTSVFGRFDQRKGEFIAKESWSIGDRFVRDRLLSGANHLFGEWRSLGNGDPVVHRDKSPGRVLRRVEPLRNSPG